MERHRLDDAGCGPAPAKRTDLPDTLETGWQGALKVRGASTETWPMDHRRRGPAQCWPVPCSADGQPQTVGGPYSFEPRDGGGGCHGATFVPPEVALLG